MDYILPEERIYKLPPLQDNGEFLELRQVPFRTRGIFFIFNEEKKLMYIGAHNNIRQSIINISTIGSYACHRDVVHNYKYAKYVIVDDPEKMEEYMINYINILKPKLNKDYVYTYESEFYSGKYNRQYTEEAIKIRREMIHKLSLYEL